MNGNNLENCPSTSSSSSAASLSATRQDNISTIFTTSDHQGRGHSTQRRNSVESNLSKMNPQRPVVDLVVAMISVPTLIIFALMLETNMRENWTEESDSKWTVLALGMGLVLVSLLVCGYVTHRMGVCLWAGPQDDPDYHSSMNRNNSEPDLFNINDHLPPSYETCVQYDMPPPPYDCVVIDIETKDSIRITDSTNHI